MYTITELKPNHNGEIRYAVRNDRGWPVYTVWTREDAEAGIERMLTTGTFERPAAPFSLEAFAARLDADANLGFTRD